MAFATRTLLYMSFATGTLLIGDTINITVESC